MNIGTLNKRICIQKRHIEEDENGFEVEFWQDYRNAWARIKNINGKEYFQAQQAKSKASKKIVIRYIKELDTSINTRVSLEYRVAYKGNFYNLLYSDNIQEKNNFLELMLEGE